MLIVTIWWELNILDEIELDEKKFNKTRNKYLAVKTELQHKATTQPTLIEYLNVYDNESIPHSRYEFRYEIGQIVTVQEILYESIDTKCKCPIVYPGQVGIIFNSKKSILKQLKKLTQNLKEKLA